MAPTALENRLAIIERLRALMMDCAGAESECSKESSGIMLAAVKDGYKDGDVTRVMELNAIGNWYGMVSDSIVDTFRKVAFSPSLIEYKG